MIPQPWVEGRTESNEIAGSNGKTRPLDPMAAIGLPDQIRLSGLIAHRWRDWVQQDLIGFFLRKLIPRKLNKSYHRVQWDNFVQEEGPLGSMIYLGSRAPYDFIKLMDAPPATHHPILLLFLWWCFLVLHSNSICNLAGVKIRF